MNLDEKNYPNLSDFLFFKSKKAMHNKQWN